MFGQGLMGDLQKLLPQFKGFDDSDPIDASMSYITDDKIDNVVVNLLPESPDSPYLKSTETDDCPKCDCDCDCDCDDISSGDAPIGSAGNSLVDPDPDQKPQLGSIAGVGGGFSLTECDEGSIIDESPMKNAQEKHSENALEKVKELFDQFSFQPQKNVKFDSDTTKVKNVVATEPIRRIPRGW